MGWPGLGQEVSEICDVLGLPDVNIVLVSKNEVKKAIFEHHYHDMINIIKNQSKLHTIKEDDFKEVQQYFNYKSVEKTRMAFMIRSQMVPEIPGNFKNKFRGRGTGSDGLACPYCMQGSVMTQSHCLACPAWSELRGGLDITKIDYLVVFFRKLLVEMAKVL